MFKSPIAVLTADVHYSLSTLELADRAFKTASDKAKELDVPLIDCGDLTNDKAVIRAEVMNRLKTRMIISSRSDYNAHDYHDIFCLVGNHSLINEKAPEHALGFLPPYAHVIDKVETEGRFLFVPYACEFPEKINKFQFVVTHKGLKGANMGHYVQDRSSQDPSKFSGLRVISGHYHAAQDIPLPDGGMWSYVGSPYTLNFGEAFDPPKGYAVLYDDGSLERIPLNLRKHVVITYNVETSQYVEDKTSSKTVNKEDIVKVVLEGPKSLLTNVNKQQIAKLLSLPSPSFKLELNPYVIEEEQVTQKQDLLDHEILDGIIDSLPETKEQIELLKQEWRNLI